MQLFSHNVLIRLSKLLGQRRWNVGLVKTFNLSYHMINSDCKSQSYAHLMVSSKISAKPRWPPKMSRKNNTELDLHMGHALAQDKTECRVACPQNVSSKFGLLLWFIWMPCHSIPIWLPGHVRNSIQISLLSVLELELQLFYIYHQSCNRSIFLSNHAY